MAGTIFIETTVLNSFLGEESDVYVKIGQHFVRKKGKDLQEGDKIVVKTENIDKDPEEVYAVLDQQSLRYQLAKKVLFEDNSQGQAITRLRTLLWRGMADSKIADLERKVLLEGDDFEQREYRDVAEVLSDVVDVRKETVRRWLQGEVIAPENWENFNTLFSIGGNEGNEFAVIYNSKDQNIGFHAAYQLYVGLRSSIMSYLAKRTGEGRSQSQKHTGQRNTSQKGKFTPEIEAVVRMFIDEIDYHYVAARITMIKTLEKGTEKSLEKEQPDPNLSKGIVATKPNHGIALPMQLIRDTHYVLQTAFIDVLNTYVNKLRKDGQLNIKDSEVDFYIFNNFIVYILAQFLPEDRSIQHGLKIIQINTTTNMVREELLRERSHQFMEDLCAGKIDELCQMNAGTITGLIDTINQYGSALPKSYYEMRASTIQMNLAFQRAIDPNSERKEKREAKREEDQLRQKITTLEGYLLKEYKLSNKKSIFMRYHIANILSIFDTYDRSLKNARELISNPTMLLEAKNRYMEGGMQFFTRDETLFLLARAGYQNLITVYDKNSFI